MLLPVVILGIILFILTLGIACYKGIFREGFWWQWVCLIIVLLLVIATLCAGIYSVELISARLHIV